MKEVTFKDLRLKSKLTQKELSRRSGYSKNYISMIERGKRSPSDRAKEIFAKIFDVPIVQIFLAIQRTKSTKSQK